MISNRLYDLRNKEEVSKYIFDQELTKKEEVTIDEIGFGNMNYIYRIKDITSGKSLILKYAAEHTRISKDILVSTDRIEIEVNALIYLAKYVPDYVPQIYQYDKINRCILMEDYKDFHILRDLLLDFEQVPNFAEQISTFLVNSLLPTSELVLEECIKAEFVQQFSNPLCDITKTFVFTEPFDKHSSTNDIFGANQNYIDQEIYQDNILLSEIEHLKNVFSNKKQALLHGDLHTGSIFTNKEAVIVFDYEFAFIGPIGFDLGNLIANLIFAWLHAGAFDQKKEYMQWLEEVIMNTIDLFKMKFINHWEFNKAEKALENTIDIQVYLNEIIHDTAAFAGVEIIRRVVGIAHVNDITSIASQEMRKLTERKAIQVAKDFIINNSLLDCGSQFIKVLQKI